ncbi:MAG: hypothetical protein HYR79_02580 [Nitrospirae bacterium]|nr:hypothetical protein [Nitrospirota bacterium]
MITNYNQRLLFCIFSIGVLYFPIDVSAFPVEKVEIEGARTHSNVVRQLLDTTAENEFDPETWKRDIQRIKNTGLFYDLHHEVEEENGKQVIHFHLRNKISLIPIFKYKQGGGTSLLTVGAYEVNFLDRLLEIGAQYENMSGRSGGVAWFRHPYFYSRRNNFGTEVYVHTINLPLFTSEGVEEGDFDNEEVRWNTRFLRELTDNVRAGIGLSLYRKYYTTPLPLWERLGEGNRSPFTLPYPSHQGRGIIINSCPVI